MATITFVDIATLAKKTPDGSEKIPISSTEYVAVSDIMGQLNYVQCTYAELVTLRNATQLQAGNYYLITDYETVYVQPNTNTVKTSAVIEPLLVLAISDSEISDKAWSINHPKDTIFYDIDGTNYQWVYSGATMITHKGVITRRIDKFGNDLPYDFKTIKSIKVMTINSNLSKSKEKNIKELLDLINLLKIRIKLINKDLIKIKDSYPFNQTDFLNDEEKVNEYKNRLDEEKNNYIEEYNHYENIEDKIINNAYI